MARTGRSFGVLTASQLGAAWSKDFSHALGLGADWAETSLLFADRGPGTVTGIDISEHLLRIARKRGADRANRLFDRMNADQRTPGMGKLTAIAYPLLVDDAANEARCLRHGGMLRLDFRTGLNAMCSETYRPSAPTMQSKS